MQFVRSGVRLTAIPFVALLVSCAGESPAPPRATLTVHPVPILSLGVAEGDSSFEFSNVTWALPLLGDELAVANSGSGSIRFFSVDGRFLRSAGRKGNGPGEFTGAPLYLSLTLADTLLVLDAGNARVTHLSVDGRVARSGEMRPEDSSAFAWIPRVLPRSYVFLDEAPSLRGCTDSLIPALAASFGGEAAGFYIDQLGYVWAHRLPFAADSAQTWEVRDLNGRIVGHPALPAGFTPYAIGMAQVTGRLEDSLGVEHVVVLRLERQTRQRQTCGASSPAADRNAPEAVALTVSFGAMIQAQEAYYAGHASYARDPAALDRSAVGALEVVIVEADRRHWFGLLIDPSTGTTCAGGVGYQPPGWREASPRCR